MYADVGSSLIESFMKLIIDYFCVIFFIAIPTSNPNHATELIKSLNSIVKFTNEKENIKQHTSSSNAMKEDHFFRQEKPFLIIFKLSDLFSFFSCLLPRLVLNESEHFSSYTQKKRFTFCVWLFIEINKLL